MTDDGRAVSDGRGFGLIKGAITSKLHTLPLQDFHILFG
jgi:hypothetical protein